MLTHPQEPDEERITTDNGSQSDQKQSTAPASPSSVPASPLRETGSVDNGDLAQCSSTSQRDPCQDPDTTFAVSAAASGAGQGESVYSNTAQQPAFPTLAASSQPHPSPPIATTTLSNLPPFRSNFAVTFTPNPVTGIPTVTTSNLPDFDSAFGAVATAKSFPNEMARFSKRVYRQAHQTIEFFDQQPTPTQASPDARPTSTMITAGVSVTAHGAGSSAFPGKPTTLSLNLPPLQVTMHVLSVDHLVAGAVPSISNSAEKIQTSTTIQLSDMHYGITQATRSSVEAATKSESATPLPRRSTLSWGEMFCCLTRPVAREAARDTILHLVQKIEQDKVEKGCQADYLPFLADYQIIQMINKAKVSSEWLSNPDEVEASRKRQASSTRTVATPPSAVDPKSSNPTNKTAGSHDKPTSQETDVRTLQEEQNNIERLKTWGDILIRENRKMRNKWMSETEAELHRREQTEEATDSTFTNDLKTLLEAVKAGDEEDRPPTASALREDVSIAMELAVKTAIPSEPPVAYSQEYADVLAAPGFLAVAKATLMAWCTQEQIHGWSRQTGRYYQRLVRAAGDLPEHAWASSSPPLWKALAGEWFWQEEQEEATTPLTKTQKRAKARKEARKAKRAEEGEAAAATAATAAEEVAAVSTASQAITVQDDNNFRLSLSAVPLPLPPTPYPAPPSPPHSNANVLPWALSLSGSQLGWLSAAAAAAATATATTATAAAIAAARKDSLLALRGHHVAARRFLLSAARLLTPDMYERVVAPGAHVLSAIDLPVARYRLLRWGFFGAGPARQSQYEGVAEMVAWARRQGGEELLRGAEEARLAAGAGMKPAEVLTLVQQVLEAGGAAEEEVQSRAAAVWRFLRRWPHLEGVVLGRERAYRPEIA